MGRTRASTWPVPGARAPGTVGTARTGRRLLAATLPPLSYVAVAIALTATAWAHPTTRLIGAGSNPDAKVWFLAWFAHGLATGHLQLFTALTTAPHPINLMWNNGVVALAVLLSPLTLLAGPVLAYNVAMTGALATSGWVAAIALRRYARNPVAVWLGGAAFGFSPFILAEGDTGHLPWVNLWAVPLLLILLDDLVRTRGRSPRLLGLGLGAWAGFELLTAEELVVTCALVAAGALLWLGATHRDAARAALPRAARALAVALPVALLIAAVPLAVQFLGPHRLLTGVVEPPSTNVADLLAIVLPTQLQAMAPPVLVGITQHFTGYPFDRVVYLGVPLCIVLGWVVLSQRRDPRVRFFAGLAAVVMLFALGSHLHVAGRATGVPLPWWLVAHVPLLGKVLPARLFAVAWLAVAALITIGVDRLAAVRTGRDRVRSGILVGCVVLSLVPASGELTSSAQVPAFFRTAAPARVSAGGTLLTTPIADDLGCPALLWQAASGFSYRTPTGCLLHAASRPGVIASYAEPSALRAALWSAQAGAPARPLSAGARALLMAQLHRWRVRAIAAGPGPGAATTRRLLADLLRQRPRHIGGVWLFTVGPTVRG